MKSIIQKLVNKQPTAQAPHLKLMRELEGWDDFAALQATSKFLTILNDTTLERHAGTLESLLQLDEYNHSRLEKIILQYVKFEKLRPELESSIIDTCYYYQRQIFLNYRMHVEAYEQLDWRLKKHEELLPLIISRALNAAFGMIKMRYFQHQRTPDGVWKQIFGLFLIAEKHKLLDEELVPYAGEDTQTIAALFSQACMLDSINQSNLNRVQIEIAAKLLRKLLYEVRVTANYDEKQHFYFVDLAQDRGARRVRMLKADGNYRYWATDQLVLKIELLAHARNQHDLLEKIGIGELASHQAIPALITQLQNDWSKTEYKRQRRKEARKPTAQTASIVLGADAIFAHARNLANRTASPGNRAGEGRSFEERLSSHSVNRGAINSLPEFKASGIRWTISDESTAGYGAILPHGDQSSLSPGLLVGLQLDGQSPMFVIGILKNITELPSGQRHAGIEVLSHNAIWVQVTPSETSLMQATQSEAMMAASLIGFSGIYLAPESDISNTASVILPRLKFQQNLIYRLNTYDAKMVQRLTAPVDAKSDWVRVCIEGTF